MAGKAVATISKLAVAVAVVVAGASAGQAAKAAEPKASSAKKDKSKRVCRSIVRAGTRLSTRQCMSQEEWDDAQRKTQDNFLDYQREGTVPNPGPN